MRDHKIHHNYKIFGGMFGIKYSGIPNWKNEIYKLKQKKDQECMI